MSLIGVEGVQQGTEHTPLRSSGVEGVRDEVLLLMPATYVLAVRKLRTHLHREKFSLRSLSLVASLEGTKVLNTE